MYGIVGSLYCTHETNKALHANCAKILKKYLSLHYSISHIYKYIEQFLLESSMWNALKKIEENQQDQTWFFEMINEIDKLLVRLTKKERKKT